LEGFGWCDWIEMKPGVRKFFRLWGYTPASSLGSWKLRSHQPFWPDTSTALFREGASRSIVSSLRSSVTWRAICRSFVMATPPRQFIRQYRESLIWESVQFCTDISGSEHAIFEFYGRHFVDGFPGADGLLLAPADVRTLRSAPVFATSRLHVLFRFGADDA
jgi:hypothetical protein